VKVRDVIKMIEKDGWFIVMKYLVIIEKTGTGYSAFSPDLPGCVATGSGKEEVESNMKDAVAFHLKGWTRKVWRYQNRTASQPI
jgi:predicted RNase H-like HicB family nuclease